MPLGELQHRGSDGSGGGGGGGGGDGSGGTGGGGGGSGYGDDDMAGSNTYTRFSPRHEPRFIPS